MSNLLSIIKKIRKLSFLKGRLPLQGHPASRMTLQGLTKNKFFNRRLATSFILILFVMAEISYLFVYTAPPARAAIQFVQQDTQSATLVTSVTTASLTFTAGNIIIAGCITNILTETLSMSDSNGGNTWQTALGPIDSATNRRAYQFYAANIVGGTYTVTCTKTGGTAPMGLVVAEYSGIATSSPLDQTGSGTGNSTSLDISAAVTTTQANELLLATGGRLGLQTYTAGTNYTLRSVNTSAMGLEEQIVSVTGSYLAPLTVGVASEWVDILGTYKAAVAAAVSPVRTKPHKVRGKVRIRGGGRSSAGAGGVKSTFSTAGNTTYTVPSGITSVTVKAWGAGAGGGNGSSGFGGGAGGGGGFAQGTITVTSGESLTVYVGGKGSASAFSQDGGGGGGYSAVTRSTTYLIQAGGGGAGGGGSGAGSGGAGGAGGGNSGVNGSDGGGCVGSKGSGGTQSAGGAGGTTCAGTSGATGSANTGGQGGSGTGGAGGINGGGTGGATVTLGAGGGGGGGQFGGGGGADNTAANASGGGGGGGGSDLVTGTSTTETAGSGTTPGNNGDVDYTGTVGVGGAGGVPAGLGSNGNDGYVVIATVAGAIGPGRPIKFR